MGSDARVDLAVEHGDHPLGDVPAQVRGGPAAHGRAARGGWGVGVDDHHARTVPGAAHVERGPADLVHARLGDDDRQLVVVLHQVVGSGVRLRLEVHVVGVIRAGDSADLEPEGQPIPIGLRRPDIEHHAASPVADLQHGLELRCLLRAHILTPDGTLA